MRTKTFFFLTSDWGIIIEEIFAGDIKVDVIGFAGSKYKPKYVTGWTTSLNEFDRDNVFQLRNGVKSKITPNYLSEHLSQVVTLDGLCFLLRKELWIKHRFDEQLKGFHFYDLEYSIRLSKLGYKLFVTFDIDIVHNSFGNFDEKWLKLAIQFHTQYNTEVCLSEVKSLVNNYSNDKIKKFWSWRLFTEKISIWAYLKFVAFSYNEKMVAVKILKNRLKLYANTKLTLSKSDKLNS